MKRFTHIATLLTTTALLSASALAQGGNGATSMSSAPMSDPSASASAAGGSTTTTTTSVDQTTSTDTLAGPSDVSGDDTLPTTGGEPMLFVLGGIALMGTALVMRRKATNFS